MVDFVSTNLTRLARVALAGGLVFSSVTVGLAAPHGTVFAAPGDISGETFRDHNHNGVKDSFDEAEPGVIVVVYDDSGLLATTTSAADGTYSFTGLGAGPFRVEFEPSPDRPNLLPAKVPDPATPGAIRSGAAVQFTPGDVTDVHWGVQNPLTFCENNPRVAAVCFQNGRPDVNGKSVIQHDYQDTAEIPGNLGQPVNNPEIDNVAFNDLTGAIWGLGVQRSTKTIFAGAMMKRHVGLGDGGINGIYRGTSDVDRGNSLWFTGVDTSGGIAIPTNVDRGLDTADSNTSTNDTPAFDLVGKVGWGGMAVGGDDRTLFGINVGAKTIAAINIASVVPGTATGRFTETAIPDPGCNNGVARPWAIGQRDGNIMVGVTCDGSSPGSSSLDLFAYVYEAVPADDPSVGGLTFKPNPVITIPLDYDGIADNEDKGCTASWAGRAGCAWRGWVTGWDVNDYDVYDRPPGNDDHYHRSQPLLSDIEFDDQGYMMLAFTDRTGHQLGAHNHPPIPGDTSYLTTSTGGDLLIASPDDISGSTYTLEANGTVGNRTTAGNSIEGPGGREFFYEDLLQRVDGTGGNIHRETYQGAIAYAPGTEEVLVSTMDPFWVRAGGATRISAIDGTRPLVPDPNNPALMVRNGVEYYEQGENDTGPTFAKAGGLGDLTIICEGASLQVGNRTWFDTDQDGIQDPSEAPLPGVQVELLDAGGAVLATTTTDANGEYYFEFDAAGNRLLEPETTYQIRFQSVATTDTSGVPGMPDPTGLSYTATNTNDPTTADNDDQRDSDAVPTLSNSTIGIIEFQTDGPGAHNHTLDAGFVPTLRLGNLVWVDANNNGIADGGEAPLPNVTTELWLDNGDGVFDPAVDTLVDTVDTDVNGEYLYEFLGAGDYFVAIPQAELDAGGDLEGFASSTGNDVAGVAPDPNAGGAAGAGVDNDDNGDPNAYGVVSQVVSLAVNTEPTGETGGLAGGDDEADGSSLIADDNSNLTVDFGFYQPMRVGNLIWLDTDNSGTADAGESGIAGVLVQLIDSAGAVIAEAVTDGGGNYWFDVADVGSYRIGVPDAQTTTDPTLSALINPAAIATFTSSANGGGNPAADANGDVDNVDDGVPEAGFASITGPFDLDFGTEPTTETGDFDDTTAGAAEAAANTATGIRPNGNSNLTIDLGFSPPNLYRVGNLVWLDANNDGLVDAGESPIEGVVVQLTDALGNIIATTTTNATGNYEFTNLAAGDYRIQIPKDQTLDAGDPTATASLAPSTGPGVDPTPDDATTGEDNDSNGSEPGGVADDYITRSGPFTLGDSTDPFAAGEPTDETVVIGGGSGDDDNGNGLAAPDDIGDTESDFTVDFGFFEPLRVGNLVWEDNGAGDNEQRNDGIAQDGEPGIAGVLVQLLDAAGAVVAETVTDVNGNYVFDGLEADTYQVGIPETQTTTDPMLQALIIDGALDRLTSSDGTGPTVDNPSQSADSEAATDDDDGDPATGFASLSRTFDLDYGLEPAGETGNFGTGTEEADITTLTGTPRTDTNSNLHIDFGFAPPNAYRVGNLIWTDTNNDGIVDPTETGLDGVTVELLDAAGVVIDSVVTADGGKYLFEGLDAGTYSIRIPDGQAALNSLLPSNGGDDATPDNDVDNTDNGTIPVGSTGIETEPFTLGDPTIGPLAATEPTNETNVADGGGGVADDPGSQGATTANDLSNFTIDIGYFQPLRIGSTVWRDDGSDGAAVNELFEDNGFLNPDEPGVPGVLMQLLDASETVVAETVTNADGRYVFDGLTAGFYRVGIPADQTPQLAGTPAPIPGVLDDLRSSTYRSGTDQNGTTFFGPAVRPESFNFDDDGIGATVGGTDYLAVSNPAFLSYGSETANESFGDEAAIDAVTGRPYPDANSQLSVDFGLSDIPTYRIGNLVFADHNDNGVAESGEPGIPGVLVQLTDQAGTVIRELVTDADGKYVFGNLDAGDYRVQIPADQIADNTALQVFIDPDALADSRSSGSGPGGPSGVDADSDVDNNNDGNGDLLAGGDLVSSVLTLGEGNDHQEPIDEQLRSDDTTADDPGSQPSATRNDRSNLSVDFGIFRRVRIGNQVWLDDGDGTPAGVGQDNGVFDSAEVGIAGVTVELWEDTDGDGIFDPTGGDTKLQEVVTDGEGNYHFAGVEPGVRVFVAVESIDSGPLGIPIVSSTGQSADATAADNDDDGAPSAGYLSVTDVIVVPQPGDTTTGEVDTLPVADDSEGDANDATGFYPDTNSELTVDLGFLQVPLYQLGNLVWFDSDNDGLAEVGEPGIEGVLVQLLNAAGDVIEETVTDVDGKYLFDNLAAGDYRVRIPTDQAPTLGTPALPIINDAVRSFRSSDPDAADPNTDVDHDDNGLVDGANDPGKDVTSGIVTLGNAAGTAPDQNTEPTGTDGGPETFRADDPTDDDLSSGRADDDQSNVTVDFGFYGLSLGNQVWFDDDDSGTMDVGELPIPGVLVELWQYSGTGDVDDIANYTKIREQATNKDGAYLFSGLQDAQTYKVVIPASNFEEGERLFRLSSSSGSADPEADPTDSDDNGIDPATPGGAVESNPITLNAGEEPLGETDSDTTAAINSDLLTPDGSANMTVDFGFVGVALGDQIFVDNDNNGLLDGADVGIENVTVELYVDTDGNGMFDPAVDELAQSDVTDVDGRYYFSGLGSSVDYFVHIPASQFGPGAALDGFSSSSGNDGADGAPDVDDLELDDDDNGDPIGDESTGGVVTKAITLTPGGEPTIGDDDDDPEGTGLADGNENLTVDLGFYQLEVGNTIFFDADNNEQFDAAESGIAGVTVNLLDAGGAVVATTTTAADGTYLFTGLQEGTYSIELPASNFEPGGPLAGLYSSDGPDAVDSPADVDADTSDTDDNGRPADPTMPYGGGAVVTEPFDLSVGGEPDDENDESPNGIGDTSSNLTVDLGLTPLPTLELGNTIWFDLDNDGTLGATEQLVPDGVVVALWADPDGDGVPDTQISTTTTAGGKYIFQDLDPGTYIVQLPQSNFDPGGLLEGFGPSTGAASSIDPNDDTENNNDGFRSPNAPGIITGPVTLDIDSEPSAASGEVDAPSDGFRDTFSNLTVDLGLIPGLELGNQIFIDTDNSGSFDTGADAPAGEQTAGAGVVVNLLDDDGNVIDTTTTDAQGRYLFSGLGEGTYVVELPLSNFLPDGPLAGYFASSGSDVSSDPEDSVDSNSDGIEQDDRSIRSGPVTLTLANEPRTEDDPAVTTDDGFSNLTVDFGVYNLQIGSQVFFDFDNNGDLDGDDRPVEGVLVNLLNLDGSPALDAAGNPLTTLTDADGNYLFTGLREGQYIAEIPASNFGPGGPLERFASSTPTDATDTGRPDGDRVVADPVMAVAQVGVQSASPFGFTPTASVGNFVWVDIDRDGVQDPGEMGVSRVVIELLDGDGTLVATTMTDIDGAYLFDNLPPGTYSIRVVGSSLPPDATLTRDGQGDRATGSDVDPDSLTSVPFTLAPGQFDPDWDIGVIVADLPATGSSSGMHTSLALALSFLMFGGFLVLSARRRRHIV